MKVKNLFRNPIYPIRLYDSNNNEIYYETSDGCWFKYEYDTNNNRIYYENSNGWWWKYEYDTNNNQIYYENSNGLIEDNRKPKELTMDEIANKFGIPVNQLKIKKQ